MAQFDVHVLSGSGRLVVDCQTNLLAHIDTRFVIPLETPANLPAPARQLNPQFIIDGEPYILLTQAAAAIRQKALGRKVASLADHDREIMNALDFLLTGV